MSTKSRRFVKTAAAVAIVGLLFGGRLFVAEASPARSALPPGEGEFQAAFAGTPLSAKQYAGIRIADLALPGLQLSHREIRPWVEGGIVLSYVDATTEPHVRPEVRVVIELAVTPTEGDARKVLDIALHAVAANLVPISPSLGDYGFHDESVESHIALVSRGNVAVVVRSLEGAPISAIAATSHVMTQLVSGHPTFPALSVELPSKVFVGQTSEIHVATAGTLKLRAEGGYISRSSGKFVLHPDGPGAVVIHALQEDALGCVSEGIATATAQ